MDTRERITIRLRELRAERDKGLEEGFKARRLKAGFTRQGRLVPMRRR